jgi:hypothetical protein
MLAALERRRTCLLLAALCVGTADALPEWSWDTIQTYVHCANYTGEWNDVALAILAKQPFVVFEKYHKAFAAPRFDGAEAKITESCRKVKAINPKTECYIYTESDWARTEYSLGHWFDANPNAELQCPSAGTFVGTNDTLCEPSPDSSKSEVTAGGGCSGTLHQLHYKAYDFNNSEAREKWVERVTNCTASGFVDGAFIDGNRGGFNSGVTGSCSPDKRAGWAAGLQEAVGMLSKVLGPTKTLISNCESLSSHFRPCSMSAVLLSPVGGATLTLRRICCRPDGGRNEAGCRGDDGTGWLDRFN